ncbi:Sodium/calcium exchanger membrane region domain-containing protein [Caenorhabditis elegans]|uniref:Sodium/calcium exchanger membrane region domain-containing protein n=1 Tax=Caenorhabditis elegans TaxID=6239 RepID=O16241_CAEEL|nr:Sodium/calcium exchanger membrane region domain-containing protein [Caenorhabditis elegans]CCD64393.1 Sodium/calcium exchanger membrane region domain-containing protein [Caenorhabditis elegans]|eukprot:NP_504341.1 Na/Ca eXchangers [Caenorhabditis elegans]
MGKIIWLFGLLSISIVGTNSLLGYEYENYDYPTITMARNASMYDGMPFTAEMCAASECELHKGWTSEEKCAYIKCNQDSCEGGGYLTWSHYVKCQYNIGARVVLIIVGIIYLIFLFVVMSTIADDFFCPSISGIVTHLKMSESIAGVTFLAFGNGAPDVFGSISSVLSTPKPKAALALGDLFGTSIFVTTVVLAIIIFTKSFKVAIIPTLRDLIFYMITLAFITFCFLKFDKIEVWMPATFLGIYAVYLLTVIAFSIYRTRRKNLKKKKQLESEKDDESAISRPESVASNMPICEKLEKKTESMSVSTLFHVMVGLSRFMKKLNRTNKIQSIENKKQGFVNEGFSESLDADELTLKRNRMISLIFRNKTLDTDLESMKTLDEMESSDDEGREEEFAYAHHTVFTSHDQMSLAATEFEFRELTTWRSRDWIIDLLYHLKPWPSREEFSEMNIFVKIIMIIRIIPSFFMKMTIPSNEMSWCKPLFLLHCFASIQFALFSIQIINLKPFDGSPGLWLYGLAFSATIALLALCFLPLNKELKYHKEVYSYLGFLMSIAWIYATANEIISVMTMVGVVTGLSQELLGLTVMSWSDCIGDIVADIAVIKQGYPKMAMAAAIGGPLFNLLIGFGLPFTIASAQGKQIDLIINPVYRILLLFLGISLVTTFVALFIERFTVRWPHAVALIFIFINFVIFVCLAEFHVLEWN